MNTVVKNRQYYKFCLYGFLKNLRFFDAFFILYLVEKGLPYTQIGILYAVREITINVFEIPSGFIADTYGRKYSLIGSFLLYIFSFASFYLSNDFGLFLMAFVLYGIADAFRSGTHKGMIMDYLKIHRWEEQKINYYGHTRSWSQMGSALSSLIAGIIVFNTGSYRYIFLYSVIPYLINLFLVLSYPKELNRNFNRAEHDKRFHPWVTLRSFFSVIKRFEVLKIINTTAIHSAYLKAVKDYIQILMVQVAVLIPVFISVKPEKKNGLIIGTIYFVIYLLTSRGSVLSGKIASKKQTGIASLTLLAGFSFGIASGIFYISGTWIPALLAFVGIFIVENIRKPILTGFIADRVPNEILTSVISAQSQLSTLMTALLALLFGVLSDLFGIGYAFIAVSAFLLLATVLINYILKKKRTF